MGTKTHTDVIYTKNPNYGQPGEPEMLPPQTVTTQVPTTPLVLSPDQVLDLMPATVVKAIKDSTAAAVIKRYEAFKLKGNWTQAEGDALFTDMVNANLMTPAEKAAIVWPEG